MKNLIVCQRLNQLRIENNLSALEFAKRLGGIPSSSMSRYLTDREPSLNIIIQASKEFDVSLEWLVGLSDIHIKRKEKNIKKYTVHFMGYYGYDIEVEAESEEEAIIKATPIFDEADVRNFNFVSNGTDVWEL